MSGDYSRFTDRPRQRYTGVRMQQGRVQLDADWNEEVDILKRRWEIQAEDTFGGSAAMGEGFKVTLDGTTDLKLGAGRIYVHGKLAEIFEGEKVLGLNQNGQLERFDVSYLRQPFYPKPTELPSSPYIVYLDVWDREMTYLEDPELLEKALGGADTSTRIQTVWQVKIKETGSSPATCGATVDEPKSGGRLSTKATTPPASPGPCELSPTGGYRGLENRLYRVEVHTSGDKTPPRLEDIRFKWSGENASVVSAVEKIDGRVLTVSRIGRDKVLRFQQDDWVEVTDDFRELMGEPGEMAKISQVDEATQTITLDRAVRNSFGATKDELKDRHTRVRRWDQKKIVDEKGLLTPTGDWMPLESEGIDIKLTLATDGNGKVLPVRTGDYWVFAARTADNSVEALNDAPPRGIEHFYCQLAAVRPGAREPVDCRPKWPPRCCALTISPGEDLKTAFESFQKGQDVSVCIAPGQYEVTETLVLDGLGHVKIEGAGAGTVIKATGLECALRFRNCGDVLVRAIAATVRKPGGAFSQGREDEHINGTLTFEGCTSVTVEGVTLDCADGDQRTTSCITVEPRFEKVDKKEVLQGETSARIRGCDLTVGNGQVGILVLNGRRVLIEDNTVAVASSELEYDTLIRGLSFRSELRGHFISEVEVDPKDRKRGRIKLRLPGHQVRFVSAMGLPDWRDLLALQTEVPDTESSPEQVVRYLHRLVDRMLHAKTSAVPAFEKELEKLNGDLLSVASQGIVVGGRTAGDIRILDNSVTGARQGIHVGISHAGELEPDNLAGRVRIAGNRIVVQLAFWVCRERHGIFVGSVENATVENNQVQVVRKEWTNEEIEKQAAASTRSIDGIRVRGLRGAFLLVTHNHLVECTKGIYFEALAGSGPGLWRIKENVLVSGVVHAEVVDGPSATADVESDNLLLTME